MCSRLWIGSASMPSSANRLEAAAATRSRSASPSPRWSGGGAANDESTCSGSPAVLPGV